MRSSKATLPNTVVDVESKTQEILDELFNLVKFNPYAAVKIFELEDKMVPFLESADSEITLAHHACHYHESAAVAALNSNMLPELLHAKDISGNSVLADIFHHKSIALEVIQNHDLALKTIDGRSLASFTVKHHDAAIIAMNNPEILKSPTAYNSETIASAIVSYHEDLAIKFLEDRSKYTIADAAGNTVAHTIARNPTMAPRLIENVQLAKIANNHGITVAHIAVEFSDEAARRAMENFEIASLRNNAGSTVAHLAVIHESAVNSLLRKPHIASLMTPEDESVALSAAMFHYVENRFLYKILLAFPELINLEREDGISINDLSLLRTNPSLLEEGKANNVLSEILHRHNYKTDRQSEF